MAGIGRGRGRGALVRVVPAIVGAVVVLGAAGVGEAQALPASVTRACANADAVPGTVAPAKLGAATVCLVNRVRSRAGLPRLRTNRQLNGFATAFTRRLVAGRFFEHDVPGGPTFTQRARASAYARAAERMTMGENLAWATAELATPARIVQAWLDSPGHRANIMNRRFREIGMGVMQAAPEAGWEAEQPATYVHAFGWRVTR